MCSQRWPLSQEANKARGTCSVCFETHQIHLRGNTVHLHGPRSARCSGSNKPPLAPRIGTLGSVAAFRSPVSQGAPAGLSSPRILPAAPSAASSSASVTPGLVRQASSGQNQCVSSLAHPSVKCPIIKHIPKSARPACCSALVEILTNILRHRADQASWVRLFEFCPSILSIPAKSCSNLSVSSVIKARLSGPTSRTAPSFHYTARRKQNDLALSTAVSSKVEDGNIKAALRLLCSEDTPADTSDIVFSAMQSKHPPCPSDRKPAPEPDQTAFTALQVSEGAVLKALKSFPAGSSGGPDGLRPQHLVDLVSCKTGGPELLSSLTSFVNLILDGGCPVSVNPILFGARLIAIEKKSGGLRPIAVGYTIRRLAAKCANIFAQQQLADYFRPYQLGVAVAGGCEAAVHATRRFIAKMGPDQAVVKLDFSNAFNSLRRDSMLFAVSDRLPQIYKFCWASYHSSSILQFGDKAVVSAEGVQQGDPLGPLLFCLTLHPLLTSLSSKLKLGYLDDVTLGGNIGALSHDVSEILARGASIGLCLNASKCEFICHAECPKGLSISEFAHVASQDAVLLGAPLLEGSGLDQVLADSCSELSRCHSRLPLISAHDALLLLKASLSTPRLSHVLRSSPCSGNSALETIDNLLRTCVSRITNTELSDSQWSQACLPVKAGGLGVRLASHIAPSAFLAAAHSTRDLQSLILRDSISGYSESESTAVSAWSSLSDAAALSGLPAGKQLNWDRLVVEAQFNRLLRSQTDETAKARLLAVSAPHSGDWLNAIPISNCGLRLDDEAIRVAVGLRLGSRLCAPHTCVCSVPVQPDGLHGLSCKRSSARILRHNALNDIIYRSLLRASVPAVKEPPGLVRSDGKRPDGATQIPWVSGKCLTWDVTVTDTLAPSYVSLSAISASNAAERAAANKLAKYASLTATHEFAPVAIETLGALSSSALAFLSEIGKRLSQVTADPRESAFLFQRISICLQRFNSLSIRSTFGDFSADDL